MLVDTLLVVVFYGLIIAAKVSKLCQTTDNMPVCLNFGLQALWVISCRLVRHFVCLLGANLENLVGLSMEKRFF